MGVVLYILLSGEPPFFDEDNFVMYELVKAGQFRMESPVWAGISAEAKDLIRSILIIDPDRRLTGAQIMAHPWMTKTF